ncbi:sigma-54-dependent transcriptional regulator [Flagellimonas allohymeniacidonis]|uniref:Sigma-54-dependent Fis family transcriptional regulator n=1 Tax=Flagellimonas allohymeniacidonis TaxID=2517819 RepID=A0A4Q8QFB2_9FLAO|nr:sigma-54 dependent transcriptional regulator [Allomuricauda hymeniacidonis]TAI47898.1 sigma-54-dependent Fis family transcriptional regulator [Allomuricauda hymeniacidonis]
MPKILIIEDDTAFCQMLSRFLTKNGFAITTSYNLHNASEKLKHTKFDVILSDVRLPEGDGLDLLLRIKSEFPETQVIMMTGYAEVKTAVNAMKKGAFDYIAKPFTPEEILNIINKALKAGDTSSNEKVQKSASHKKKETTSTKPQFVAGISESSQQMQQYIELVAPTSMSVLLVGESGTGKEVTARMIHDRSHRRNQKFVAVDCGAIPKEIATSEFFGHLKGSFTGAIEDKMGHFEAANGGTLFLDEIGNLSYENQVQLLRALQERKIKRVGSTHEVSVDVRIISATNENLEEAVEEGRFREDLYHRINEFSITIPPLRARIEDLLQFATSFLEDATKELGRNVTQVADEAKEVLLHYSWPGNLRELKNVMKRAVLFTEGETLKSEALPQKLKNHLKSELKGTDFSKETYEKERILKALKQVNFNKSKAAKLLQITRKTLYNKINQYQLDV